MLRKLLVLVLIPGINLSVGIRCDNSCKEKPVLALKLFALFFPGRARTVCFPHKLESGGRREGGMKELETNNNIFLTLTIRLTHPPMLR